MTNLKILSISNLITSKYKSKVNEKRKTRAKLTQETNLRKKEKGKMIFKKILHMKIQNGKI